MVSGSSSNKADLIKLDVEGEEDNIVRNMPLANEIIVEYHNDKLGDFIKFFTDRKYKYRMKGDTIHFIKK